MTDTASVIIPAAGFGTRMRRDLPKQYLLLAGEPILVHTVRAFSRHPAISRIIVAAPADRLEETEELLARHDLADGRLMVVAGGERRQDSVLAGLNCLGEESDLVLVHDGARPLVDRPLIDRCLARLATEGAAIAAIPVKDTLKKGDEHLRVAATVDRSDLWQAQTPQGARRELLLRAYKENGDTPVTDEASLLEAAGIPVNLVEGSEKNIKITRPEDLVLAERIMNKQPEIRIGHGYDAHRLVENRDLILAGITIPHHLGLAGHSDADVLTHALCDAILGALGQGDIGRHFPDSDPKYKNVYSILLLEEVVELAQSRGYALANADITVVCQAPRLADHLLAMGMKLAETCRVGVSAINIKATTTEKMGFTGRQEGIGCHAVVLLQTTITG